MKLDVTRHRNSDSPFPHFMGADDFRAGYAAAQR